MYISVAPMMYIPNQLIGAPRGTEITLECQIEASPKVKILMWIHTHCSTSGCYVIDRIEIYYNSCALFILIIITYNYFSESF